MDENDIELEKRIAGFLEESEGIPLNFLKGESELKRMLLPKYFPDKFGKGAVQDVSKYNDIKLGHIFKQFVEFYLGEQPIEDVYAEIPIGIAPVRSLEKIEVEGSKGATHYIAKTTNLETNEVKYSCSCKSYSPVAMFPRNPNECKHINALKVADQNT